VQATGITCGPGHGIRSELLIKHETLNFYIWTDIFLSGILLISFANIYVCVWVSESIYYLIFLFQFPFYQ
jgi:hypothetical protein